MKKLHSVQPSFILRHPAFLLFFLPLTQAHTRFIPHLFTPFSQSACVCTINPSWPFIFNCHTLYLILMSSHEFVVPPRYGGNACSSALVYMTGSAPLACPQILRHMIYKYLQFQRYIPGSIPRHAEVKHIAPTTPALVRMAHPVA